VNDSETVHSVEYVEDCSSELVEVSLIVTVTVPSDWDGFQERVACDTLGLGEPLREGRSLAERDGDRVRS
jgi:hypothetical protein